MIDTAPSIDYALRKKFEEAGLPRDLAWGKPGLYLAHWYRARSSGKKTTVAAACEAAGLSSDALRQRRRHSAEFAAAERWARRGEPFTPPVTVEPQHVGVVELEDPLVTDTTWPAPPLAPVETGGRPLDPDEPTSTTLPPKPAAAKKERPTRRYTPAWMGGDYQSYFIRRRALDE